MTNSRSHSGATLYFAYGSNMDPLQMSERCPGARPVGTALLSKHAFRINRRGVATVVSASSDAVHGVLWQLNDTHVATLDVCEGVAEREYEKHEVGVYKDGMHSALIYIAMDTAFGRPRVGYLERILRGAEHFALPIDYITRLKSWGYARSETGGVS